MNITARAQFHPFPRNRGKRGGFVYHTLATTDPQPARRFHFKLNPYVSQTGYYTVEESGAVPKSE